MKVKLYKKFVKYACRIAHISREQLFSRRFKECVLRSYSFDFYTKKHIIDCAVLHIFRHSCPLSQVWKSGDFSSWWLFKYWKHSHWKDIIKVKLDLGSSLEDVLAKIAEKRK